MDMWLQAEHATWALLFCPPFSKLHIQTSLKWSFFTSKPTYTAGGGREGRLSAHRPGEIQHFRWSTSGCSKGTEPTWPPVPQAGLLGQRASTQTVLTGSQGHQPLISLSPSQLAIGCVKLSLTSNHQCPTSQRQLLPSHTRSRCSLHQPQASALLTRPATPAVAPSTYKLLPNDMNLYLLIYIKFI